MVHLFVFCCIVLPFLAGAVVRILRRNDLRRILVPITVAAMAAAAIGLGVAGPFRLEVRHLAGIPADAVLTLLETALPLCILLIGWRAGSRLVMGLTALQLAGIAHLHRTGPEIAPPAAIAADGLSLLMTIIVCVVGGLITIYAMGYMDVHESRHRPPVSRKPRFFATVLCFLGAMNGLVLFDDLRWVFLFWEATTLCSYLLIAHDDTPEARSNALCALWMNVLGGLAFVSAMLFLRQSLGTLSAEEVLRRVCAMDVRTTATLLPFAFLCLAAFTKSAQVPFESWLCGAMVAPTPVSALLHSATMVKAGTYLLLRMAPAFAGTTMSTIVALFGAFTFVGACLLAVGQQDAKRLLAYSTIANLGLIIACVGINTTASATAATVIIVYHSVSKGLLFACVGSIEQRIGSRDIEDMRGLRAVMPRTATIAAIGILTMLLPPFGMLTGKWLAIEAIARATQAMPPILGFVALGSALTVLFWTRWAGAFIRSPELRERPSPGPQRPTVLFALKALCGLALVFSLLAPVVLERFIVPAVTEAYARYGQVAALPAIPGTGLAWIYGLSAILAAAAWMARKAARNVPDRAHCPPYACGAAVESGKEAGFRGPMDAFVPTRLANCYLRRHFDEAWLTRAMDTISTAFLVVLVGGLL
ncbi:MAG: NADH-quinone oxidoreductase subunit L [Desulfovibrio sp.]|jgi:ech hydrogenase subunit A|nr:NADH-quinone oxidoreductase subunit L [Desulfovibrio sp.]